MKNREKCVCVGGGNTVDLSFRKLSRVGVGERRNSLGWKLDYQKLLDPSFFCIFCSCQVKNACPPLFKSTRLEGEGLRMGWLRSLSKAK